MRFQFIVRLFLISLPHSRSLRGTILCLRLLPSYCQSLRQATIEKNPPFSSVHLCGRRDFSASSAKAN